MRGDAQGLLHRMARHTESRESGVERVHDRAEKLRRLRLPAFETPQGGENGGERRAFAGNGVGRIAQLGADLFRLHHGRPALGKLRLFARFRRQSDELGVRVAQIIGIGARLGEPLLFAGALRRGEAQRREFRRDTSACAEQSAIRIEKPAVDVGVHQGAIVMLTMNFDEVAGNGAQRLGAHRLIIDEGASTSVRHLHAAQNELAFGGDVLGARRGDGRMIGAKLKKGGDLALRLSLPHEGAVAARPKRQREGVEQNRFSRAGLPGEHREAATKFEIELVDQHDVANSELNEHGAAGGQNLRNEKQLSGAIRTPNHTGIKRACR